jgi:hypothetical protein
VAAEAVVKGGAAATAVAVKPLVAAVIVLGTIARVQTDPLITAPGTGVATGTGIATRTAIEIATETATVVAIMTGTGIASGTRVGTEIATEIGTATASTKTRGFTTPQTMATIGTAPTPMRGVTRMACLPAPAMGDAVRASIRNARTSTGTALLVSFRSSAAAALTSRHIVTVFCAATRKATRTGKGTLVAAIFIDSSSRLLKNSRRVWEARDLECGDLSPLLLRDCSGRSLERQR